MPPHVLQKNSNNKGSECGVFSLENCKKEFMLGVTKDNKLCCNNHIKVIFRKFNNVNSGIYNLIKNRITRNFIFYYTPYQE